MSDNSDQGALSLDRTAVDCGCNISYLSQSPLFKRYTASTAVKLPQC